MRWTRERGSTATGEKAIHASIVLKYESPAKETKLKYESLAKDMARAKFRYFTDLRESRQGSGSAGICDALCGAVRSNSVLPS